MPFLEIDGREYTAQTNFKFEKTANQKYGTDEVSGFMTIYLGLLQEDTGAIGQFWDCALAHYKDAKPSLEKIEAAIEKRIEEEDGTDNLLKEAFQKLDNSGFFRKQARFIVKEFTKVPEPREDETPEEKKKRMDQIEISQVMKERYEGLTGQTLIKL